MTIPSPRRLAAALQLQIDVVEHRVEPALGQEILHRLGRLGLGGVARADRPCEADYQAISGRR